MSTTAQHMDSYRVAESIAARDNNNLYITSSFFRDRTKYTAFCAFYAVMRIVDDRIDNLPQVKKQNAETQKHELEVVDAWEQLVVSCHQGIFPTAAQIEACDFREAEAVSESAMEAFRSFPVPIQFWTNFFDAMRSDLVLEDLDCWSDFLEYSEGATVAPTTIYLYLITMQWNSDRKLYELPEGTDIIDCGRCLGLFAYLAHIMRDLAEDLKSMNTRLCITCEDMIAHDVSLESMRMEAMEMKTSPATRELMFVLLQRSRVYLVQGRKYVSQLQDVLDNDCRFILDLITTMYEHIIDKLEWTGCDPMTKQHYLSRAEKTQIVQSVAVKNGYDLPIGCANE